MTDLAKQLEEAARWLREMSRQWRAGIPGKFPVHCDETADLLTQAAAMAREPRIPARCVVVPEEPTSKMCFAGFSAIRSWEGWLVTSGEAATIYKAMIDAARSEK